MAKFLIEDTRQQTSKHENLNKFLENKGYKIVRSKLYVGDYAMLDNMYIAVDTKKDIYEVIGNLTKQHERFRAECIKAKELGIKLTILIEENIHDLDLWESPKLRNGKPKSQMNGKTLKKIMTSMHDKYGVDWVFCDKKDTGKVLLELLGE